MRLRLGLDLLASEVPPGKGPAGTGLEVLLEGCSTFPIPKAEGVLHRPRTARPGGSDLPTVVSPQPVAEIVRQPDVEAVRAGLGLEDVDIGPNQAGVRHAGCYARSWGEVTSWLAEP